MPDGSISKRAVGRGSLKNLNEFFTYNHMGLSTNKACKFMRSLLLRACSPKVLDLPNWSGLSNVAEGTTLGVQAIPATVRIEPETLNLESKGIITAFIQLPDGYDVSDIDPATIMCFGAAATKTNVTGNGTMIAKFDREAMSGISIGDEVVFTVTGCLLNGTPFEGSDTVRVIR
jgi:hypothetical protein